MTRSVSRPPTASGTLVLDSQGLSQAVEYGSVAEHHIAAATRRNRLIMASSLTLAEVLRGTGKDARVHRFLRGVKTIPADDEICRLAGRLLHQLPDGSNKDRTVDAVVVATTLLHAVLPAVILTSDRQDITRLLGNAPGVVAAYV